MDFLGNVNVFHGRVENGYFRSAQENVDGIVPGSLELAFPEHSQEESRAATVYIRPHELEVALAPNGKPSLRGRILHVNPAGPVVKVQIAAVDTDAEITVNLAADRYRELRLKAGDTVYVFPQRVRVFLPADEPTNFSN